MASCLPLSRLELIAPGLLPRRSVPIVVCDAGEGLAERAAARLTAGGYTDVSVLAGGVAAWEAAGFPVYSGVHVPSKAFAEVVEHEYGTPWITVEELAERQKGSEPMVIFDSRSYEEYHSNTIPGAISVPGAELVYRFNEIVAVGRHFCCRQLRWTDAQHHRRAVADRRRRAEPRRLAKGRHDGLAPRWARGRGGCHRARPGSLGRWCRRRS